MIRLGPNDFRTEGQVERLASAANMTTDEFRARFAYLANDPLSVPV